MVVLVIFNIQHNVSDIVDVLLADLPTYTKVKCLSNIDGFSDFYIDWRKVKKKTCIIKTIPSTMPCIQMHDMDLWVSQDTTG